MCGCSAQRDFNFEGISVGAIASDYQRIRVENMYVKCVRNSSPLYPELKLHQLSCVGLCCRCRRLGLTMLAYLWHRDQKELMAEMIDKGVNAIVIKVAAMG